MREIQQLPADVLYLVGYLRELARKKHQCRDYRCICYIYTSPNEISGWIEEAHQEPAVSGTEVDSFIVRPNPACPSTE